MPSSRLRVWWRWGGLLARLIVGGVWIAAGWLKIPDPAESVRAVRAYQLLPEAVVPVVGYGLPILELMIGALLIVGLATRISATISSVIECGCFGGGGTIEDATSKYPGEIARDVGLLILSGALALWPRTALSLDAALQVDKEYDE